jgi:proline iminopeptidase
VKVIQISIIALFALFSSCNSSENEKSTETKKENLEKKEFKLFTRSFGEKTNPAILFLHGGPGYNCANFEATTAQNLANKGFFVIVYDRRGEGRSIDKNAAFTFDQTFADLNSIYAQYELDSANLIGHSYGGVIATLFAEKNPKKVSSIILVGAPISLQETFKTIISSSKKIYQAKNDSENLKYIEMLEKMDTTSIDYSSYCFAHAMQNGFYTPKKATEEAKKIYASFKTDTLIKNHAMKMTQEAPAGFMENEKYTVLNLTENIKNLMNQNILVIGLYGKEDGLYSENQIKNLEELIGEANLKYFENCSHNVFIDQQEQFFQFIREKLK